MKQIASLSSLKDALPTIHKALILMSATPNLDSAAAALGLAMALKAKGIDVQVACPVDMRVEFSRLVGVDEVKKKIGNRNLQISFDYSEDKVEKVSYTISDDGKKFNLVIAPKNNATALDPATVGFDYVGAETDATFLVGVNSYEDIGALYEEERNVIEGSLTIACTLFPVSTYAKFHADAQGLSSLSELIATVLSDLQISLEADSASNLLYGIDTATQSLSSPLASADTFETVALLMRAGAKRQPVGQQGTLQASQFPFVPTTQPTSQPESDREENSNSQIPNTNPFAAALSKTASAPVMPQPQMGGEMKG